MINGIIFTLRYLVGFIFIYVPVELVLSSYDTYKLIQSSAIRLGRDPESVNWIPFFFGYQWEIKLVIMLILLVMALFLIPPTNAFIKKKTGIDINGWKLFGVVVGLLFLLFVFIAFSTIGSLP